MAVTVTGAMDGALTYGEAKDYVQQAAQWNDDSWECDGPLNIDFDDASNEIVIVLSGLAIVLNTKDGTWTLEDTTGG